MSIVSYAQNLEDVMLYRALRHVRQGVYVDVGANDPVLNSVTKVFYDRGWSGVNIEPVSGYFLELQKQRPRDSNLQLAASDSDGTLTLYEIPDTGLSTIDSQVAAEHAAQGFGIVERRVDSRRLDDICGDLGLDAIHFLKIDVEGAEHKVLAGLSLQRLRPWIIVIESTAPLSDRHTQESWEPPWLRAKYAFAYFDGLNRFYVADEQRNLADSLRAAPGLADDFVRFSRRRLRFALRRLRHGVRKCIARIAR
jgi:FkbM family methyltransferase